jgi:hypothetical protein
MGIIEKQLSEYLKGDYVKEKGIQSLKILTEAKDSDSKDFGVKLECNVSYDNMVKDAPYIWSMNKTSRNVLIDFFGKDTKNWIGRIVPVETAVTEKGRAIHVDVVELKKQKNTGILM